VQNGAALTDENRLCFSINLILIRIVFAQTEIFSAAIPVEKCQHDSYAEIFSVLGFNFTMKNAFAQRL
jgi:hypothetical protein